MPVQAAWPFFLDIDDGGGLSQLVLEPGVPAAEVSVLIIQRIGGLRHGARALIAETGCAPTKALPPRRQLRGVQPVLTEDGPPPWVATRVGVVLIQDGLSLGSGQGWSVGWVMSSMKGSSRSDQNGSRPMESVSCDSSTQGNRTLPTGRL